jgi:hypothetical protein
MTVQSAAVSKKTSNGSACIFSAGQIFSAAVSKERVVAVLGGSYSCSSLLPFLHA